MFELCCVTVFVFCALLVLTLLNYVWRDLVRAVIKPAVTGPDATNVQARTRPPELAVALYTRYGNPFQ